MASRKRRRARFREEQESLKRGQQSERGEAWEVGPRTEGRGHGRARPMAGFGLWGPTHPGSSGRQQAPLPQAVPHLTPVFWGTCAATQSGKGDTLGH